ncbi:hypothetical protein BP6252_11295 [Coleophoma cylindrospora]|uniref:Uncharacterized protein n=1 Tax=Coleophoma cylindrospora TaxID=1849047 RepID=A0A3D8QQ30_9HELO|nr:hypothetical protein BP6252_11295 [Coleophoma cylindrospora]
MATTAAPTSIVYNIPEVNSGTTTSWIPLTTAWPSLTGCESSFLLYPGQPSPVAWDPGYGLFGGTPRCLPPAATTWHEQDHQGGDLFTFISIRPILEIEVNSNCDYRNYDLHGGQPGRAVGTCTSPLTPGQTITYLASNAGFNSTTIDSSTYMSGVAIRGWNIATSTTLPPSNITNTSQSCSGLSRGAKGGIGASVAIGGIGIMALIWAFFLLRRRPTGINFAAVPLIEEHPKTVAEMAAQQRATELPST